MSHHNCHYDHQASAARLRAVYDYAKKSLTSVDEFSRVDPRAVFVNNELNLKEISVYGFDYDYTLAVYTRELNELIYNLAMQLLIKKCHYPKELLDIPYDKGFAIRGLHYDIENCILMKLDAFSQIQRGTVYRGWRALSDDEVSKLYCGFTLPEDKQRGFPQLLDLFSLPWAGLLATTVHHFDVTKTAFDANSLYHDIAECVKHVHTSGELYRRVMEQPEKYLHKNPGLAEYLNRLHKAGKTLFMVTNSPFNFMNTGMTYMLGPSWRDLFTYIIVQARKPHFFKSNAPFRLYHEAPERLDYKVVEQFEPGKVYSGGNIRKFGEVGNLYGKDVLYFGDHIYTDLQDPLMKLGWHTAAIVPELAREIRSQNTDEYRRGVQWLESLANLIANFQAEARESEDCASILEEWRAERKQLRYRVCHWRHCSRNQVKIICNPRFGSMFRTYHNMTYFSRRLMRLSEIYTSRLPNLLKYDVDHVFFPRRNALPHESLNAVPTNSESLIAQINGVQGPPMS